MIKHIPINSTHSVKWNTDLIDLDPSDPNDTYLMPLPGHDAVQIYENFIPPQVCPTLIARAEQGEDYKRRITAYSEKDHGLSTNVPDTQKRIFAYPKKGWIGILPTLEDDIRKQCVQYANEHLGTVCSDVTAINPPYMIGYRHGDSFNWHSDSYRGIRTTEEKKGHFVRHEFREWYELGCILYISDGSELNGGDLEFRYIKDESDVPLILTPKRARLIIFPTHPYYVHRVTPQISGFRVSMTSFWRIIK